MSQSSIVFESKLARTRSTAKRARRARAATSSGVCVAAGLIVVLAIQVRDEQAQVIERSTPDAPCRYVHGAGTLLAGLERVLEGRRVGETVRVVLPAAEAHGVRQDLPPFRVARQRLPQTAELRVGMALEVLDPLLGLLTNVWIESLDAEHATLSREHPLAGQSLDFELTVLALESVPESIGAEAAP